MCVSIDNIHRCMMSLCVCVCVCVCVCLSRRANLWTGASRCLTEGNSGLSGTFFTERFVRKLEAL